MNVDSDSIFGSLLASSGILFIGLACRLGLGFLGRLVIARELGKVSYGAVSLGAMMMTAVTTIVIIGTDTGVGRYLPRFDDPARRRGVMTSAFQIVVPVALFAGVTIAVFAKTLATDVFHDPDLVNVLRIFGLTIPLVAVVRLTVGSIRGMQDAFPRVYIQNLAVPVTRFGLIAVAVIAGLGSIGIAAAYAGAYAVATALSIHYLARRTPLFNALDAIPMHRDLLTFSAPLMITATMYMLLSNFDTFMLGAMASTGDVGVYNVAYPLAQLLTITLSAFGFIFMPTISELHSNGKTDEMARTYEVVAKWIFVVSLPLFLVFVTYPGLIIRYTFGPEYSNGALTLSILTIGFFAHIIAGPSGDMLTAIGKQRLVMYDNILVAGLNIVLNLILIPQYSYLGAAVATTGSYFLMNGLFLVFLYRETGVHPFRREQIGPGLAAGVLWLCISWITTTVFTLTLSTFIVAEAIFIILYMIVVLRYGGIEDEEISLLNSFEERIPLSFGPMREVARYLIR
ncbi:flippase [Halomicrococcus sp. NG-SE-24]|uniref:flippase n=1 Tax=Halomicrococcus sp. NG-SE-24 TaxID=3436928 RepID=UPI003D966458